MGIVLVVKVQRQFLHTAVIVELLKVLRRARFVFRMGFFGENRFIMVGAPPGCSIVVPGIKILQQLFGIFLQGIKLA